MIDENSNELLASCSTEPHCLQEFARLCTRAAERGWHEANGGNLSYRLDDADIKQCQDALTGGGSWHELARRVPALGKSFLLMTASGTFLSNVARDTSRAAGIIELDSAGAAWRVAWGFEGGARPSSELETHLAAYEVGMRAGDGGDRVVYHAHCPHIIALSTVLAPDARAWSRALWQCMTECIIVFPQGIGVVPWMVPGSPELAQATCELMKTYKSCVWMQHGITARASSFDDAFGTVETIEKSAGIYLQARAASGGEPAHLVSDAQLRAICRRYELVPNEDFLE